MYSFVSFFLLEFSQWFVMPITVGTYSFSLKYLSYSRGVTATNLSSSSDEVCTVCVETRSRLRGVNELDKGVATLDTWVIDEASSKSSCVGDVAVLWQGSGAMIGEGVARRCGSFIWSAGRLLAQTKLLHVSG